MDTMPQKNRGGMPRYSRFVAAMHWVLALLVFFMLAGGMLGLAATSNDDPGKIGMLRGHMVGGLASLVVLIALWFGSARSVRPARMGTEKPLIDMFARIVHLALPICVLVMALSGMATAKLADLPSILFGNVGGPLPDTLRSLGSFQAHYWMARVIILLLALHILGAFYHQFILRDGLFDRMSVRKDRD